MGKKAVAGRSRLVTGNRRMDRQSGERLGNKGSRKGVIPVFKHDRLTRGFLAGLAGGLAMALLNLVLFAARLAEVRYLDWAAIWIYGHKPTSPGEIIFAQIIHLLFAGLMGILFAYLIPQVTSRNLWFKGVLFAWLVWFLTYVMTTLAQTPRLTVITPATAISDFVSCAAFGLVGVEMLLRLDRQRAGS